MQYAQVAVNSKTNKIDETFTYSIPPALLPEIKVGILILVPFHGRNIEGMVLNITKRLSSKIKTKKIQKIIQVLDSYPVPPQLLKLAHWISNYYWSPIGKTIFSTLVPQAKRIKPYDKIAQIQASKIQSKKPHLLWADYANRISFYQKEIAKYNYQHVIIILPDLDQIKYFQKLLPLKNLYILHSYMTKTERYKSWLAIRHSKSGIIIGSHSALFAPCSNLGLIMLDQEENPTYKNDRAPRYHARQVAIELSKISGARLVLGTALPSINTLYHSKKSFFRLISFPQKSLPKSIIVDMNEQRDILSYPSEQAIINNLQNKQKTILFINKKGVGNSLVCQDCGQAILCSKCNLPLIPQNNDLICHRCSINIQMTKLCPICQGTHLRIKGWATKSIAKKVRNLFPEAKITIIEKDHIYLTEKQIKQTDIFIGTIYLLKSQIPKVTLSIIVNADQGLNLPDFQAAERNYQTLTFIKKMGKSSIIQTHIPNNFVISTIASSNYLTFYESEIIERQKFKYPPFTKLVNLIFESKNEKKAENQVYKLVNRLKGKILFQGPAPSFYYKIRDKYRWHILLKFYPFQRGKIKKILKLIPSSWKIDVDPVETL